MCVRYVLGGASRCHGHCDNGDADADGDAECYAFLMATTHVSTRVGAKAWEETKFAPEAEYLAKVQYSVHSQAKRHDPITSTALHCTGVCYTHHLPVH